MKKNKLTVSILVLLLAGVASGFSQASNESPVTMRVWHVLGPVGPITNTAVRSAISNMVFQVYKNGKPDGALGYRLKAEYITQESSSLTNMTMYSIVRILSKDASFKFQASNVELDQLSSDHLQNGTWVNSLKQNVLFTNENIGFSEILMGFNYGPSGSYFNGDSILVGGSITNEVSGVIMVADSTFFTASKAAVENYMSGFPTDFSTTLEWKLNGPAGVKSKVRKTMYQRGVPAPCFLGSNKGAGTLIMPINMGVLDSGILQSTDNISRQWNDENSVNAGDVIVKSTDEAKWFYRVKLQ